jgi:alpha-beta hydrolase superfamily lysophospholipase
MDTFTFAARDDAEITAYRWTPAGTPRGLVLISHGMGEHARRYDRFARALTGAGHLVLAADQRGHGATAGSPSQHGVLGDDGWDRLLEDLGVLLALGRAELPGRPAVLLGHSMGSMAAQQWVVDHSTEIDGLVLVGTASADLLGLGGEGPLDLSAFNAPFEQRTGYEWLSRDEAEVDAYVADPQCGFGIDPPGARALDAGARRITDPAVVGRLRADLPVLITVGEEDPVNGHLALLRPLVERYEAAGLRDVTVRTWPGARHEVLNETNRDEVTAEVVAWLDRVV